MPRIVSEKPYELPTAIDYDDLKKAGAGALLEKAEDKPSAGSRTPATTEKKEG